MKISYLPSRPRGDGGGKVNPNASHFNIGMLQLADTILEVGDFKLVTPVRPPSYCLLLPELNKDAVWWWSLKKKVFEAVVPPNPFGETNKELWRLVSQVFPHT